MNAPTCTPRGAGDFGRKCLLTTVVLLAAVVGRFVYLQIECGLSLIHIYMCIRDRIK